MSANVVELTEAEFESAVLKSEKPVIVDFWAVWCGPCRMIAPVMEALAEKWTDRVTIAKLNVDDYPGIAERYSIMGIPTLMMWKNGQVVERISGAMSQAALEKRFEPHLEVAAA